MESPGQRHRWSSGLRKQHQPGEGNFDKHKLTLTSLVYGVSVVPGLLGRLWPPEADMSSLPGNYSQSVLPVPGSI